jgi:hypothetical protein
MDLVPYQNYQRTMIEMAPFQTSLIQASRFFRKGRERLAPSRSSWSRFKNNHLRTNLDDLLDQETAGGVFGVLGNY